MVVRVALWERVEKGSVSRAERRIWPGGVVAPDDCAESRNRCLRTPLLAAMSYGYLLVNAFHRFRDPSVEKYDYEKALHAARDRFTTALRASS